MDYDSFCRVALHFNEEDDEALLKELKEAFRLYDKEGNGFIPTSSLKEILGALDDQLNDEQLNEMVAEIDTDSSGTVDFDGKFSFFCWFLWSHLLTVWIWKKKTKMALREIIFLSIFILFIEVAREPIALSCTTS